MKDEIFKRKFIYIKIMMLVLVGLCFVNRPMTARAESISLGVIGFDDHRGMMAYINGKPVYCIQRGYPFRSSVSELQMVYIEGSASRGDYAGTIAGCMRYLLYNVESGTEVQLFRGWGGWTINGDHTDATQTSIAGAPTSNAWQEAYDEDKEDDEDDPYHNRYGGGSVRKFYLEVVLANLLTGHEGCVDVFPTTMKQISYAEAGFSLPQVYAQAITNYYCWEDSDAAGYSEEAKYQAKQALDWGIEFGFVTTIGGNGRYLRLIYQKSTGVYGISGSSSYSGSCDGYIKTTIGGQYEAMKLYRQVVWKTTNMRQIPSFAYKQGEAETEPIKLYWDEKQHLYTATVSDHNGVLDYFEFSVSGCTVTNNEDGTLTISASGAVNATSAPSKSGLELEDGVFKLPDFYRWDLEGEEVTFTYTYLTPDYKSPNPANYYEEEGSGRKQTSGSIYNHSHDYSPACNWFCSDTALEAYTNCKGEINSGPVANECDCTLAEGETCSKNHGTHNTTHSHTESCKHKTVCPYYKNKGGNQYWNGQRSKSVV